MVSRSDINKKIKDIIVDKLKIQSDIIDINDTSLLSNLGFNSLNFIKMIVEIEEIYELDFTDDDLDLNKFTTIEDIVDYVCKLVCS